MQGLCLEELLESQASDDERSYFSSLSVNPQGQLCLSLNRPLVFATNIEEVLTLGPSYGSNSRGASSVAGEDTCTKRYLIYHSTQGDLTHGAYTEHKDVMSTKSSRKGPETCATGTRSLNQLDLNEGWSLLVLGLMRKFLEACGHSMFCYTNSPQVFLFSIFSISFSSLHTYTHLPSFFPSV